MSLLPTNPSQSASVAEAIASASERAAVAEIRASLTLQEDEYRSLISELRNSEASLRTAKKVTASLLEAQHEKETKVRVLKENADAEKKACDELVRDLQQQITELTFYLRTQKQVDQSPQKVQEEMRGGLVVTTQQEPTQERGAGRTRGRRKGNR